MYQKYQVNILILLLLTYEIKAITPQCSDHVSYYISEAHNGVMWALKMIDSTSKTPHGLLYGNTNYYGNFDECLSVNIEEFQGKYCNTRIQIISNKTNALLRWGVCLPSTCTYLDVQEIVEEWLPSVIEASNITVTLNEDACYIKEDTTLSLGTLIFSSVFLFLVILIIFATSLNCYWTRRTTHLHLSTKPETSWWWSIIGCWDARETSRILFSTVRERGTLDCIHGIRGLTMLWVLLGHRYNNDINSPIANKVQSEAVFQEVLSMFVVNTYLAVDTFFLLSGILVCYTAMREIDKHKSFPLFRFYIYRYLRLTIPYVFVILYFIYIMSYIGNGPIWNEEVKPIEIQCSKYWLSSILYFQNYNSFGKSCGPFSWYLANDMQLSFLSPLVLIPLYYTTKTGIKILILLILIFCFIPFTIAYINNMFWAFHMLIYIINFDYTTLMYNPLHTRASPYLYGILIGYILYKYKDIKVAYKWVILGWIISTLLCLTIILSLYIPYQQGDQWSKLGSGFYNGFSHVGWAIGVSWVIFACVYGYGGIVNTILSWKYFIPLSRLTYAAYLTQFFVIFYDTGTDRSPRYFSHYSSIHSFFGDLPLVLVISMILFFTVESPSLMILRKFFKQQKRTTNVNIPKITITKVK